MATKQDQALVVEAVADPTPVDPIVETEVPTASKEKKSRKPRTPASHPPYIEMIREAITSLKEKTGSSQYAITKFIEEKHKDRTPLNFKKLLLFHLRKLTETGKLIKVKNSYKIPAAAAKPVKSKAILKPKPKIAVAMPKAKPSVKPKAKVVVKPKEKPAVSAKTQVKEVAAKPKTKPIAKLKPVAKVAKLKPKIVAAKPARPAKAVKTSQKDAPGNKKVAPAGKKFAAAKRLEKAKRMKATAKVATKKPSARKTK